MSELTQNQTITATHSGKNGQILMAALLGLSILAVIGLAPIEVIHNATHDVRHSSGFPCH